MAGLLGHRFRQPEPFFGYTLLAHAGANNRRCATPLVVVERLAHFGSEGNVEALISPREWTGGAGIDRTNKFGSRRLYDRKEGADQEAQGDARQRPTYSLTGCARPVGAEHSPTIFFVRGFPGILARRDDLGGVCKATGGRTSRALGGRGRQISGWVCRDLQWNAEDRGHRG